MQKVCKPRHLQDLRIQRFGGEIEDGKVCRHRGKDVFFCDALRLDAHGALEVLFGELGACPVSLFRALAQPLVFFDGEFAVDGQQRIAAHGWQADGKVDEGIAQRVELAAAHILVGGEHLFEEGVELRLPPGAAQLDVGEDAADVRNALGERLHLAHAFMHLFETVGNARVAFRKLAVRRGEFIVHRAADDFEIVRVDVGDVLDVFREARFDVVEAHFGGAAQIIGGTGAVIGILQRLVRLFFQPFEGAVASLCGSGKKDDEKQKAKRSHADGDAEQDIV